MPQQQQKRSSTGTIIFSVLLLIVMIIVIIIQLTIVTTFFMTNHRGRCVYITDDNNECVCRWTNSKTCESVNGKFNSNLSCDDGFGAVCHSLLV
jgi:hypothetical protein